MHPFLPLHSALSISHILDVPPLASAEFSASLRSPPLPSTLTMSRILDVPPRASAGLSGHSAPSTARAMWSFTSCSPAPPPPLHRIGRGVDMERGKGWFAADTLCFAAEESLAAQRCPPCLIR